MSFWYENFKNLYGFGHFIYITVNMDLIFVNHFLILEPPVVCNPIAVLNES